MDASTGNGKAVKFKSLAEKRVSRTIKVVRQIGDLSNRRAYDYRPDQIQKMFDALRFEIDAAEERFSGRSTAQTTFSFD